LNSKAKTKHNERRTRITATREKNQDDVQ